MEVRDVIAYLKLALKTKSVDGCVVDIGSALSVGHITVNLSSGTNTVSIPLTK